MFVFRFYIGGTDEAQARKVRVLFAPNFCVKFVLLRPATIGVASHPTQHFAGVRASSLGSSRSSRDWHGR